MLTFNCSDSHSHFIWLYWCLYELKKTRANKPSVRCQEQIALPVPRGLGACYNLGWSPGSTFSQPKLGSPSSPVTEQITLHLLCQALYISAHSLSHAQTEKLHERCGIPCLVSLFLATLAQNTVAGSTPNCTKRLFK